MIQIQGSKSFKSLKQRRQEEVSSEIQKKKRWIAAVIGENLLDVWMAATLPNVIYLRKGGGGGG